jgi:ABC-type transporter Mla MlaB component
MTNLELEVSNAILNSLCDCLDIKKHSKILPKVREMQHEILTLKELNRAQRAQLAQLGSILRDTSKELNAMYLHQIPEKIKELKDAQVSS